MTNILFISHVKTPELNNGGSVYSFAMRSIIQSAIKDVSIKEMHFSDSKSRRFRNFDKMAALLKSFVSSQPSKGLYFKSGRFARRVSDELKTPYDLVVIVHAEMLWLQDIIPESIPIVHISQNIEHVLYAQYIKPYLKFPIIKTLLERDCIKYKRYETDYVKKIKNVITVSVDDQQAFFRNFDGINVIAVNPAFSYERTAKRKERITGEPFKLGFIGNLEWWPNSRSLDWMIEEVIPRLNVGIELHVYGKGSEKFNDGGVLFGHGFVKELNEVWQSVDMVVNPIMYGAGVNIKVAEAIYNRMPMLCTRKALKGFDLVSDDTIAVLDDPSEWAAFLNSEKSILDLLGKRDFPNADSFAMSTQVERVRRYLEPILRKSSAVV